MGGSKLPDWGPTRSPARNAEIHKEVEADARRAKAYEEHLEAFKQRRRAKLPFAAQDINLLIPSLLNSWQQQVDSAITDVPNPAEPESKVYWYVALAGNLIWAGTCFLNPAAAGEAVLIKILSFAGAAYGSGTLQQVSPGSSFPAPSDVNGAREMLRKQVAQARGKLETYFEGKRDEWATGVPRLQDWNTENAALDAFNKYVWEQMFPWIPYDNDRFDAIRVQAIAMVKEAYANYMRQWQQFVRDAAWYGEATRTKYGIVFKPVIQVSFGGKPLWDAHEVVRPGSPGWEKQLEFH
jgi:hypothetical protein